MSKPADHTRNLDHAPDTAQRPRRRPRRISLMVFVLLLAMWVLLWGDLSWANVISGIAVIVLMTLIMPLPPLPSTDMELNVSGLVRLMGTWTIDFLVASVQVAWIAIRRQEPPPGAFIEVPMRTNGDITLATAMALVNLQPGGIIVDVDKVRKTLTLHLLDASSTGKVDDQIARLIRLERRIVRALENRDVEDTPMPDLPSRTQGDSC